MIRTQTEAKRFLVGKVVAQARAEGTPLSSAEERMLSWSESDPDLDIDPGLPGQLASEISDKDYETKVTGLLARAFAADIARAPGARAEWKHASEVLHRGDHYILIMLDAAVGRRLRSKTNRRTEHPLVRYIGVPLFGGILAAAGMTAMMLYMDLTGDRGRGRPHADPVSLGQALANLRTDSTLVWVVAGVTVLVLGARALLRRAQEAWRERARAPV